MATRRSFTEEELSFLRSSALVLSRQEIADKLGRDRDTVNHKMAELGLPGIRKLRQWSAEDLETLRTEFDGTRRTASMKELAKKLSRSESSVTQRLRLEGLWKRERNSYKTWSKQDLNTLMFKIEKHTVRELAKMLDRSVSSVQAKVTELDYKPLCAMYSLTEAARMTGYDRDQLVRAKDALQQKWKVVTRSRYALTECQIRNLCDWLRDEGKPQAEGIQQQAA